MVEPEIIADAGERRGVGIQTHCRKRGAIPGESTSQLLREMQSFGGGATVAACHHLAAVLESFMNGRGHRFEGAYVCRELGRAGDRLLDSIFYDRGEAGFRGSLID